VYIGEEYEEILLSTVEDEDEGKRERERERKKSYNRLNEENVTHNRVYDACINLVANIDFQNL